MKIVLIEPEIPQNTGNIARLCAATGVELWLVGRLGFSLTDKYVKRAAMDYWGAVNLKRIETLDEYYLTIAPTDAFISTKGEKIYSEVPSGCETIVFGNESSGLPANIYKDFSSQLYKIPMKEGIRSLNLSSSAAIVCYHLLEKNNFTGLL